MRRNIPALLLAAVLLPATAIFSGELAKTAATDAPSARVAPAAGLREAAAGREPASEITDRAVRLWIVLPDIVPTVGRSSTIHVRLEDPGGRVAGVRFSVNGKPDPSFTRNISDPAPLLTFTVTPDGGSRLNVLAEALGSDGAVLARDVAWLTPFAPYRERVRVRAPADWYDLLPAESPLRQHPVVMVHPLYPERLTQDERRFGLNGRPVRALFLVDEASLGPEVPRLLQILSPAALVENGILRASDEVAVLLLSRHVRIQRDFPDGSLQAILSPLQVEVDAPADLGDLLTGILAAAPADRTTACIILTNGVQWGTFWKRKEIPDIHETEALLTPDDISQIHSLSFAGGTSVFTIALSTPDYPLEADETGHLDFTALEARMREETTLAAMSLGSAAIEAEASARIKLRRFDTYIRQMFDLLRAISEATEGGRKVVLSGMGSGQLSGSIRRILAPIVGKFQRRDFRVVEAVSRRECGVGGQEQSLDAVQYRSRDKVLLAMALDESGSTQTEASAREIVKAARHIIGQLRPADDCIMLSTFSAGLPASAFECLDDPSLVEKKVLGRVRLGGGTDIYGAALEAAHDLTDMETVLRERPGSLAPDEEVRKVVILVTDGYQTVNDTSAGQAIGFLRDHGIMLFEILIPGLPSGQFIAGWSSSVGGLVLPPDGAPDTPGERQEGFSRLIESVYWGTRESYRIRYVSTGREKDRREVCVGIRNRSDLYVSREGGDSYVGDKSATAHLLDAARNTSMPLSRRKTAIRLIGRIGTEYELASLRALASGEEKELVVASFLAYVELAGRVGVPWARIEKTLDDLDPSTRLALIHALGDSSPEGSENVPGGAEGAERLLLHELRPPPGRAPAPAMRADDLRLQALLALGRLGRSPSTDARRAIEALADDPDPALRQAAVRLLDELARLDRDSP